MARLQEKEAELRRVEILYEQAKGAIRLEIDKALVEMKAAKVKFKILRKGHRAAKAWMRTNLLSYGVGVANTKDMLDSLAAYARSQLEQNKAVHDMLVSVDKLHAAVGMDLGPSY
jgi:outer membrane protein TolC